MRPEQCCHSFRDAPKDDWGWWWSLGQSAAAGRQASTLMPCMGHQLLVRSASMPTLLKGLQAFAAVQQPPRIAHLS